MNPLKGEVPLYLADGREFTLVLDMLALIEAEAAYGKPLPNMMLDAKMGFVGPVNAMLFGALRTHHASITLRDAAAIYASDGDRVADALEAAEKAAFPTPEKSEGGNGENPPGKRSGRSGARRSSTPKRSSAKPRAPSK